VAGNEPSVIDLLAETEGRHHERDTLKIAMARMTADERDEWTSVIECRVLNTRTGKPYAIDHIVKALGSMGYQVSPAAVRRWRLTSDG